METGTHEKLSYDEYSGIDREEPAGHRAVNYSALKHMEEFPLACLAVMRRQLVRDSDDLKFGRDVHSFLLTPDEFEETYLVAGGCEAELKSGVRRGEPCGLQSSKFDGERWYCGKHGNGASEPEFWVKRSTMQTFDLIGQRLAEHPASVHLSPTGLRELTIVAELYGVRVKGRLDHLDLGENLIVDVKKCQPGKSAVDAMERAILKYGYYQQLGFYQMLVRYITGSLPECRILFIEDDWPFGINCRRLNSRLLAIGRADCVRWLHRFKACRDSGEWPDAYPESVSFETGALKSIDGPDWLHDRYTDEDLWKVGGFDESERPDMVAWEG